MPTRLENFISHGEISNTKRGVVTGTLWLINAPEPITLELEGNCHRDIAGCVLVFENPDSSGEDCDLVEIPKLDKLQRGVAGDITASKKVLHHESILDDLSATEPVLANSLSIEWYSDSGERFVIDTVDFRLHNGVAEWQMDAEEEQRLVEATRQRFHDHIDAIAKRIPEDGDEDDQPLDEFEWERRLKESDRITDAYMEALDKYQNLPDQEEQIAAAMNRNHSPDSNEDWIGDEDGFAFDAQEAEADDLWLDIDDSESDGGDDSHPLYERSRELSMRLHREAQEMLLLDSNDEASSDGLSPVQTLVFATMELSAKLAEALHGVATQSDPEPGLIVAWLKRGLPVLGRALGAAETASTLSSVPTSWIETARQELFELRASMLDLIQEFRRQLP